MQGQYSLLEDEIHTNANGKKGIDAISCGPLTSCCEEEPVNKSSAHTVYLPHICDSLLMINAYKISHMCDSLLMIDAYKISNMKVLKY